MFEAAEVGNRLSKTDYKRQAPKLRTALLQAQRALAGSDFSLVLVIGGEAGAGKTELANLLLEWLDARGVAVQAWGKPTDEERQRPFFWRFWRILPPKRKAAILLTSWYSDPIADRVFKKIGQAGLDQRLDQVADFERMLVAEGVLLVKLWLHISKSEQRRRFKRLESDPRTRWRVTKRDWRSHKRYDRFREVCERSLMKTSTGEAPWLVVDAADRRYRDFTAARIVLDALQRRQKESRGAAKPAPKPDLPRPKANNVIRRLDLGLKLDERSFDQKLEKLQNRIGTLTRFLRKKGRCLTLAFEGPDAAGKGGAIRRLTQAMDARLFSVDSVAAPSDEEKARPYLWRFWRNLPRTGKVTLYDRSWYGRVLVERVEGFALPQQWRRAYAEINAFEGQMAESGIIVRKFWIAISADEQLRRFKDRQGTPYKQYKITPEDWRNRAKWDAYEAAACEMIERTSTEHAPWIMVEGNDKRWARIKILKSVAEALESAL
jgi:polyphosphate:AMP phosphotransferase